MEREEIFTRFRNKIEDLAYASVNARCHGKGEAISAEHFYCEASVIFDEALDRLLGLQP